MRLVRPGLLSDTHVLSALLDDLLFAMATSPLHTDIGLIAFETKIPARVLKCLASLHLEPENSADINAGDFHTVFSNILCRYPTIRIWLTDDGRWFFEL